MMRAANSKDWESFLATATLQLNSRPMKKLGNLAPKDFSSLWDDPKLGEALEKNRACKPAPADIESDIANQAEYERSKELLQVGTYVYVDKKKKTFSKSFDPKV